MHEFMTLDGVIDAPTLTFDYPFLPEMVRSSALRRGSAPANLSLAACESYENGVVYLAYRPKT